MSDAVLPAGDAAPLAAPSTADFAAALNDKDDATAAAPRLDLPPPLLHHDSGIESTLATPVAPSSIPTPPPKSGLQLNVVSPAPHPADTATAHPTDTTPAVEPKKTRHEDYDEEAYLASIDLDAIPSPVVLGGGPTTTMSEAASARAEQEMRSLTLAAGGGMIPVEAKRHFPQGPTAGPYRTWRQQKGAEARARAREATRAGAAGAAAGAEKKSRWR